MFTCSSVEIICLACCHSFGMLMVRLYAKYFSEIFSWQILFGPLPVQFRSPFPVETQICLQWISEIQAIFSREITSQFSPGLSFIYPFTMLCSSWKNLKWISCFSQYKITMYAWVCVCISGFKSFQQLIIHFYNKKEAKCRFLNLNLFAYI